METLNIHKDWLTFSGGTNRPGELCHDFTISKDLSQMVNLVPTQIPDCDSHTPALFGFLSSDASISATLGFPIFGNSDHVVASISKTQSGMLCFIP